MKKVRKSFRGKGGVYFWRNSILGLIFNSVGIEKKREREDVDYSNRINVTGKVDGNLKLMLIKSARNPFHICFFLSTTASIRY